MKATIEAEAVRKKIPLWVERIVREWRPTSFVTKTSDWDQVRATMFILHLLSGLHFGPINNIRLGDRTVTIEANVDAGGFPRDVEGAGRFTVVQMLERSCSVLMEALKLAQEDPRWIP